MAAVSSTSPEPITPTVEGNPAAETSTAPPSQSGQPAAVNPKSLKVNTPDGTTAPGGTAPGGPQGGGPGAMGGFRRRQLRRRNVGTYLAQVPVLPKREDFRFTLWP